METVKELAKALKANMKKVILGKDDVIDKVILCLLSAGHILLEDIPGTGKTTLAKALARSVDCGFKRVQFTPDLLPSDLTGINFFNQKEEAFLFRPGAVFTNILLADEINRATPRTQSSLLECMEERQVSVDGETYPMARPFLVIATQNPIEIQGTFPLPEAQLDRFFMRLSVGYPAPEAEKDMLTGFSAASPLDALGAAASGEDVEKAQAMVREVMAGEAVKDYMVRLARATREDEKIRLGVSPRGTLALLRASQAHAAVRGGGFVTPDDVKAVFADVVCHRILCRGHQAASSGEAAREIARQILVQTAAPTEAL
ncbi:MAG: MoxR family ATPase [Oscillospiraceae bacterium]|nr:MoxR family ATPase [Oscillospiraceae bacterium]